ncbi:probable maltase isoform X2 [Sitodiplosis mosellana]|nr:probable maltase isoform X2 [Sitodiplosis mosellana]
MKDFGYDISDYREIQPEYGTMEDFERLAQRCKEMDIKLILDFVPNHSSDQHEWFQKSINPNHPEYEKYKDYYIWNKGKLLENGTRVPPSNWRSVFRGSAWKWAESRQAFYLHQFLEEQADLNFRNPKVIEEMNEVLRFWLRKGVSGVRIDAVPFLFEAKENSEGLYDDEGISSANNDDQSYEYLNHTLTFDVDESFDLVYQWRKILDEPEFSNETRVGMSEGYSSLANTMRYYGRVNDSQIVEYGTQIPFNFQLTATNMTTSASEFKKIIKEFFDNMPKGNQIHANWLMGNHDTMRIASKYKPTRTDLFNILIKTLPGIAITYYGEEIGMTNQYISWNDTIDPRACQTNPDIFHEYSRDPERTPMQWDSSTNAGFSTANETWLPVADNYTLNNVELQESQTVSHLKVFKSLIKLRSNPTMKYAGVEMEVINDDVLVYKRQMNDSKSNRGLDDSDIIVVLLNFGTQTQSVKLDSVFNDTLPQKMTVNITSIQSTSLVVGQEVNVQNVDVPPEVGVVLIGKLSHANGSSAHNSAILALICCLLFFRLFV